MKDDANAKAAGGVELSVMGGDARPPVEEERALPRTLLRWNTSAKLVAVAASVAIAAAVAIARGRSSSHGKVQTPNNALKLRLADMPPLSEIVDRRSKEIVGPVDHLLDFGIVGFPRCGTTSIKDWITHENMHVVVDSSQNNGLARGTASKFAVQMYHRLQNRVKWLSHNGPPLGPDEDRTVRLVSGIKSQSLLLKNSGPIALTQGFNNTKLIVSLRHPIPWFQSMYNQMVKSKRFDSSRRGLRPSPVPSPRDLIDCKKTYTVQLCGNLAEFHRYLARLHKTRMGTKERVALRPYRCKDKADDCDVIAKDVPLKPAPFNGTVFLLELSQLFATRDEVRTELGNYLGLELPDMAPLSKMGMVQSDRAIYICDERYKDVREVLLERAERASRWILDYFLASPDVTVPARSRFVRTLEGWRDDPCDTRKGRALMQLQEAYA